MHSPNKLPQTTVERSHVYKVKLLPCGVCGQGGGDLDLSEAHELEQGQWFTTIPLCRDCHTGYLLGIHGQKRAWRVRNLTEPKVLNQTIEKLFYAPERRIV